VPSCDICNGLQWIGKIANEASASIESDDGRVRDFVYVRGITLFAVLERRVMSYPNESKGFLLL
jgi:hypothetical protein